MINKNSKKDTPGKAIRHITPEGYDYPERYVRHKMGALFGASKQWINDDPQHVQEPLPTDYRELVDTYH